MFRGNYVVSLSHIPIINIVMIVIQMYMLFQWKFDIHNNSQYSVRVEQQQQKQSLLPLVLWNHPFFVAGSNTSSISTTTDRNGTESSLVPLSISSKETHRKLKNNVRLPLNNTTTTNVPVVGSIMNTNHTRTCMSPEKDIPWIFGGYNNNDNSSTNDLSCTKNPNADTNDIDDYDDNGEKHIRMNYETIPPTMIVQSHTSHHICGYPCFGSSRSTETDSKQKTHRTSFDVYLYNLSQQIQKEKYDECYKLIVYGVAFGDTYMHWLTRTQSDDPIKEPIYKMNPEQVSTLIQKHGRCFITFVLADTLYNTTNVSTTTTKTDSSMFQYYSNDGLQILIPIHQKDLPYTNMRRNTKIFKMLGPSYIFPWVLRVVWQDAKLVAMNPNKPILPQNYYQHFYRTIDTIATPSNNVCASFMGIPCHKNTMGTKGYKHSKTVQFAHHCAAVIEASVKRPTVSDDLRVVEYQCDLYNNLTTPSSNSVLPKQRSILDVSLIDSAFIVWDLRSKRCQEFVATISCTWFDEVHCYSDRDQVSFPYVFQKIGLREIPQPLSSSIVTPETSHRLFAHYSTPTQPIVHISKSICHWYFQNLNDCDFTMNGKDLMYRNNISKSSSFSLVSWTETNSFVFKWKFLQKIYQIQSKPNVYTMATKNSNRVYNLAIVVVGSFQRYIFQSSIHRFIQPLTNQGHHVDYYVSLSMKNAPAYRADETYMNYIVHDPIFDRYIYNQTDGTRLTNQSLIYPRIQNVIRQQLEAVGGNLCHITLQDNVTIDNNVQVMDRRMKAVNEHPNEDPDLRFPIYDIRIGALNRTANANRNMLHLFYNIQQLWQHVVAHETDVGVQYDYVIFLRDDTMWYHNFDFRAMMDSATKMKYIHENQKVRNDTRNIDLCIPSCDARNPTMHPAEINDHIAIVARNKANIFGNYFNELFQTDLNECASKLDDKLRYGKFVTKMNANVSTQQLQQLRGCNSEMILKHILQQNNVTISYVGQGLIPFQRSAMVNISSSIHACFHKFCQSHEDPFIIRPRQIKCKDMAIQSQ